MNNTLKEALGLKNGCDLDVFNIQGFNSSLTEFDHRSDIFVQNQSTAHPHTALQLIWNKESQPELLVAFGVEVMRVALPEDVKPQEAANIAAKQALTSYLTSKNMDVELLTDEIDRRWRDTLEYLKGRWAENDNTKIKYTQLMAIRDSFSCYVGVAYGTTLMGSSSIDSVRKVHSRYEYAGDVRQRKVAPLSLADLPDVKFLSGEEKLSILGPGNEPEYTRAKAAFDMQRVSQRIAFPINHPSAVVYGGYVSDTFARYNVSYANGDNGFFTVTVNDNPSIKSDYFTLIVFFKTKQQKQGIVLEITPDKSIIIKGGNTAEKRFKSVEILNEYLRRAIKMLIAMDPILPVGMFPKPTRAFDANHPVIKGLRIPARHRHLISMYLGHPYEKACKSSDRFAANLKKKKESVIGAQDAAISLPDGSLVGKIDTRKQDELSKFGGSKTRLGLVQTIDKSSRTRREISPMYGFSKPRPFTEKHLSKLPTLTDPNAFQFLPDIYLENERRDIIEAAYRLSFSLRSSARNPFLEADAVVDILHKTDTRPELKITKLCEGNPTHNLVAIGVVVPTETWIDPYTPRSGAALMCEVIDGNIRYYLRPAIDWQEPKLPEDHKVAIRFGIGVVFPDASQAAHATAALKAQWDQLENSLS